MWLDHKNWNHEFRVSDTHSMQDLNNEANKTTHFSVKECMFRTQDDSYSQKMWMGI